MTMKKYIWSWSTKLETCGVLWKIAANSLIPGTIFWWPMLLMKMDIGE